MDTFGPVDPETLQGKIIVVARLRRLHQDSVNIVKEARDTWAIEHQGELEALKLTQETLSKAEALLREATILVYKETGNKTPAPGVGIKEVATLDYSLALALGWAKEHGLALALDKKAFEAIAKTSQIEFVVRGTEVTATIATDLDKVLGKEEAHDPPRS